ncbi:ssl1498 family light-harvesting-like protein [Nostoc sp. FACHB-152]|uniref:photosystem II assembly protein Psb34 n=1 Tax=unclassified Nostoc TaxID=2593658 RepID=UPI001689140A|nr:MULTISPECIES: ssl1498 family light-harvesting-like protein [unclassified Nostoc]MBD2447589.1 ssl1498 family light-harvesting-like protein [Nostoc sp. FACHB-152]MBD2469361.1 ssl1498 family light-harvesting-like protein [Nostoc sp. FACHB-145]
MYTTVNENGVLNNYPTEPQVYYAEYPAIWEQRNYVIQGAIAAVFVTTLVLLASAVS